MLHRYIASFFIVLVTLIGCTTTKQFEPVSGSKADGIITIGYEYGGFEKPVVDWNQADQLAREKCIAWGYRTAERFSKEKKSCMSTNTGGGCSRNQVSVTYQCLN